MESGIHPIVRGVRKFPPEPARVYRGVVVNPRGDTECDFFPDGGVAVVNGKIAGIGDFKSLREDDDFRESCEIVDETEHGEKPVIIPGFSDVHVHWVQNRVRGKFSEALLPWLREHIWPEEGRYQDPVFAREQARAFFADLAKQGTVVASIYSSVHEEALRIAFEEAVGRVVIGNVLMTDNSPPELRQDPTEALDITDRMARKFGQSYAVTPRFAPTCSVEVLREAGKSAVSKNTWVQTHLSENKDEIKWVEALFPDAASYTDVYYRAGLLGPRALMGHAIHLSDAELRVLADTNTTVAHCPTSNQALGSGRMPLEKIRKHGIHFALASDVGAGPSLSMLHVMQGYLRAHDGTVRVTPSEALYRSTLAGAEALGLGAMAGNLTPRKEADFVMLKNPGTGKARTADRLLSEIVSGSQYDLENMVRGTFLKGRRIY